VVLAVLVSWFAYGLGLLIRNSPVTIAVFLIWPLIIENLVGLVFTLIGWESAVKWLPYQAAIQATVDDQSGADVLGRPGGLIWFGVVSAAIIAAGVFLDRRRDA
jgi:hypothetical protein